MQTKSTYQFHLVMTGNDLTVVAAGELDLQAAAPLRDVIVAALSARPSELHLDLDEVTFLDATGARALIQAQRAARAAGVEVTVRGAGPLQQAVLDLAEGPRTTEGDGHGSGWRSGPRFTPDRSERSGSDGVRQTQS